MDAAIGINGLVEILLVEDSPGDVRLTQEALKSERLWNHLNVVRDGMEAMAYLHREGEFKDAVRPDLILLDLSLPRKDGREVLAEIKADEQLKCIPVVILTGSSLESDILGAYERYANCYITKPIDLQKFMKVVQAIEHFWFAIVRLPIDGAC